MFGNPYYNQQVSVDRINSQIAELEKMRSQIQQPMQPANINQTFQLGSQSQMKYVNSIKEVENELTTNDTPFFSKDLSVLWIKDSRGNIKSYEIKEIVQKDEKDLTIESLQNELDKLRKEIENAKPIDNNADESNEK